MPTANTSSSGSRIALAEPVLPAAQSLGGDLAGGRREGFVSVCTQPAGQREGPSAAAARR